MLKKLLIAFLALILIATAALWGYKSWADAHYYDDYDPALAFQPALIKDEIVEDTVKTFDDIETTRKFRRVEFTYDARNGVPVPALMALPIEPKEARLPVAIFVHGSHQKKEFIDQIATPFVDAGIAMVSFDQHMRGGRKVESSALGQLGAWRARTWMTVNDTRRLVDYLQTRDDIDPERIYMIGASYGAITGTVILSKEKRIKAATLVVGGGHFPTMGNAKVFRDNVPGWARAVAVPIFASWMNVADPVNHAAGTAGTPVLMLNGSEDSVVSKEAGEKLFAALGEPKEIKWYDIDHPGERDGDGPKILEMLNDGLQWLKAQDEKIVLARGGGELATAAPDTEQSKPAR